MPNELPKGVGRYVPAGADVLLQVHYHKSGKAETDRSAIGLYFAKGAIDKQLQAGIVMPARRGYSRGRGCEFLPATRSTR